LQLSVPVPCKKDYPTISKILLLFCDKLNFIRNICKCKFPTASHKEAKTHSQDAILALGWGDKRYIKRDEKGRITESDDQGKSLSQDVKKSAKTKVKPGYGDQGDQPKKKSSQRKS